MPNYATAGSARINAKKNGSEQSAKPSTPTQAIDARMWEEEKNRKQKEKTKKKWIRQPSTTTHN